MPLDRTEANNQLNAEMGLSSYTATVTPIKGRLMTAMGADAATNGTEVANSGGSTYTPQTVALAAVANGQTSNNATITWANLPACTVVGIELWDSAGTPKRKRYGTLQAPKTVAAGDSLTMVSGALVLTQT